MSDTKMLINIRTILLTDVGSTTTKARLFREIDGEFRYVASGEAPTTVEAPFEDVTMGLHNAIREVEVVTGIALLRGDGKGVMKASEGSNAGVDFYLSTSSAGGGLQMAVAGVVKTMTAESAQRAALGAGGIVIDVVAADDGRLPHERIQTLRNLRPDMILVAGGTDGGTKKHTADIIDLVKAADPRFRLGQFKLPIVYAGNRDLQQYAKDNLKDFALTVVDNIRPVLEVENVEPARDAVGLLFMEHVMSHAPGYDKLKTWVDGPIIPTPFGEGMMVQVLAKKYRINVLGVGLGGATTNVYSVFDGKFVRTVSANLGMSYSICNVMKESGVANIMRWIPFDIEESELRNRLRNKMIRPTTIPQTMRELIIEHALAREALRLGLLHHKTLATPLRGVHREQTLAVFDQKIIETSIEMLRLNMVVGTGGLLSHAPRRVQTALCMVDGFQLEGVVDLICDSVFMMPHLGILSTVQPDTALHVFERDCLVRIGTCIAPVGKIGDREKAMTLSLTKNDGTSVEKSVESNSIELLPLREDEEAEVEIRPSGGLDVGSGRGKTCRVHVRGGVVGLILDCRGRPLEIPEDHDLRVNELVKWYSTLNVYTDDFADAVN